MNVTALLDTITRCRVYNLEQPRFAGMPAYPTHRPLYSYFLSRRHGDSKGPRTTAQGFFIFGDHSGTHIDAFCHQAEDLVLHGGVQVTSQIETQAGYSRGGAEELKPVLARGILLDVAAAKGVEILPNRYAITDKDLKETVKRQGTEVKPGDVILVRTGYDLLWRQPEAFMKYAGVSREGSIWVGEQQPSVFGIDQLSWDLPEERDPETGSTHCGHIYLFIRKGIPMLENLNLSELAKAKQYEFLFLCFPLNFEGATGVPVCPVALA